jgi:hypothetical protein
MRRITILATVVVAALVIVGAAQAGNPDGLGPWADYVVAHNQGCAYQPNDFTTCLSVPASRQDPQAAVGPAESPAGPNQNIPVGSFYSLGFTAPQTGEASITLGFDNAVCNQPGADLAIDVFEITQEPYPPEKVSVYVSADNIHYAFAGVVTKDGQVAMPASVPIANFVKLVDASNKLDFTNSPIVADGFDLDGVRALNTSGCGGGTGTIEICKASTNGMSGKSFQFSVNGATPITVRGGRCSGPVTTAAGAVRVTELQSNPPTDVTNVTTRPSNKLVLKDLANRQAIVLVSPGSTAASETLVTFTNQPAGGTFGDLKICKLTETPQYVGRLFSFRVNGGPLFSTEANDALSDPSTWSCRIAGTFQVGTNLTVSEQIPAGAEIAWFDATPATALTGFDTDAGTANVTIGPGVTTLLVDNEAIPPPLSGYLEICKDAALLTRYYSDPFVQGPFTFTVQTSDGGTFDTVVGVGQCSVPFQVPAGITTVTEHAVANHSLVDEFTIPQDRFLNGNLINGTATVDVPVSSSVNDETQVHFVNQRNRAQLKVCKALAPGSDDLSGHVFNFDIDLLGADKLPAWGYSTYVSVVANATTTQCVIAGDFPVGSDVDVEEVFGTTTFGTSTDDGTFIDSSGGGTVHINPGINTITITNQARGLLEVCKAKIRYLTGMQPTFTFVIDGSKTITVQAGKCSPAMPVTVGDHTVLERLTQPDYELDPWAPGGGIATSPADREVSKSIAGRTVTVHVPYGPEGETLVTFYNRVRRGQVKICKVVPTGSQDAIGTTLFHFDETVNNTYVKLDVAQLANGECAIVDDLPILQPNGSATTVKIQEELPPTGVFVTGITYQGPGTVSATGPDLCNRSITYSLGAGVNITTFQNQKGVAPPNCSG